MSDTGAQDVDQDETLESIQHKERVPAQDIGKPEKKEDHDQSSGSHASTFMMKNVLRTAKNKTKTSKDPDEVISKLKKDKDMLEKQFDRRKAEFSKTKALLEQRNSLLEMERDEMKERLDGQKAHYESILKTLQKETDGPNIDSHLSSLKQSQEEHDKEISQFRKTYEKQITDLKQKINLLELSEKDIKEQLKTQKHEYKLETKKHEVVVKELEFNLTQVTSEKDKIISSMRESLDRIEAKYDKELDDMKSKGSTDLQNQQREYENKLEDIKYLHDQEQATLKNRIRKLEDELALMKDSESLMDQSIDFDFENDRAKEMQIRLSEINDKLAEDMLQAEKQQLAELNDLRKENTNLKVTIEQLKTQVSRSELESSQKYSRLEAKFNEKCHEADEAQSSIREVTKLNKKIAKLKLKIGQLEEAKRDLKDLIKQKDDELETERIAKKRAIIVEKKKAKLQVDKVNDLQRQVDRKAIEIEGLKRENLNQSAAANESRFFSPRSRRIEGSSKNITTADNRGNTRRRMESPKAFGSVTNLTEDSEYQSSKGLAARHKKMKSSSPDRTRFDLSEKKVYVVTRVNLEQSDKKLHYIPSSQANLYDDSHKHPNGKYCEACKYKKWRIEQLKYDPERLLYNRDIIKYITCLGCEKAFEVREFLKHTRDCRLSNQIPHIDGSKYYNKHQISSRRFSNNPHSMNRSDQMGSDIGDDIRNVHMKHALSRNDLHNESKMSDNPFHYRSNDNLLGTRRRRLESGDKFSMNLYAKKQNRLTNEQDESKQNEKLSSENEESSEYTRSKFDRSKVYNFDVRDMDNESEENLKDHNEELSMDDKGNVGDYKSKIHSFSNMFQNVQHIEQVSKKDFDDLRKEVRQLRDRHYEGKQLEMLSSIQDEPHSVGGVRGYAPKTRTSIAKPLDDDSIDNSAVGYSMSQALSKLNISNEKY